MAKLVKLKHLKSGRITEFEEQFCVNLLNQTKGQLPQYEIVKEVEKVVEKTIEPEKSKKAEKKEAIEPEIKID
jgi:hypothetical protein